MICGTTHLYKKVRREIVCFVPWLKQNYINHSQRYAGEVSPYPQMAIPDLRA